MNGLWNLEKVEMSILITIDGCSYFFFFICWPDLPFSWWPEMQPKLLRPQTTANIWCFSSKAKSGDRVFAFRGSSFWEPIPKMLCVLGPPLDSLLISVLLVSLRSPPSPRASLCWHPLDLVSSPNFQNQMKSCFSDFSTPMKNLCRMKTRGPSWKLYYKFQDRDSRALNWEWNPFWPRAHIPQASLDCRHF